jgi:prepilin-type N-terminal cleavage/methylation domain-containing protein
MAEPLLNRVMTFQELQVRTNTQAGFTLVEMMMTVTVFAILAGAAAPQFSDMTGGMRLRQGLREVERELQAARLKAVSSNRAIRVRFDCPAAGSYRMVEVIGTPSIPDEDDDADDRCSAESYPFPADDANRLTLPNHDGPLRQLHSTLTFGAADTLEFWPDGSIHQADESEDTPWAPIPSTGTAITIVKGELVGIITVNGLGKIQVQ